MKSNHPQTISVLLVEDEESEALVIQRILKHSGEQSFEIVHCRSLREAINLLASGDFDVCLLDLGLPDGSGIDSLHQIHSVDARIAVVVLTGSDNESLGLATIDTGAQDFVAKDALSGQLLTRSLRFAIARQRKMLGYAADANTDVLTGMPNRRRLIDCFTELRTKPDGNQAEPRDDADSPADKPNQLCVALLDIDHFKRVNDTHGHLVGDQVIKHVGALIQASMSEDAHCARFGGEEFALLLPDSNIEETYQTACDLLRDISDSVLHIDDVPLRVTASIGVSSVAPDDSLEDTLRRTDVALYEAKQSGRNRVCIKD